MHKFNLHVLTLLGALIFCVGLINIIPLQEAEAYNSVVDDFSDERESVIPLLSSSVNFIRPKLVLPDVEPESNEYSAILEYELEVNKNVINEQSAIELEQEKNPAATVTTTPAPKKKKIAKKVKEKDYVEKWAIVTAYCPCSRCCGNGSPGRTSIGKSAWKPGIAADPKAIPYGTEIYVKGYGRRYVDDTGGAMRRSWRRKGMIHLDIRMTYHHQAIKWGRKLMKVRVYKKK